jgi:hypothetical protein
MNTDKYVHLLLRYVSGQADVDTFIYEFNLLFESEVDPNPRHLFDILQDLFEDIDAYSPMWTELDVNESHNRENSKTRSKKGVAGFAGIVFQPVWRQLSS